MRPNWQAAKAHEVVADSVEGLSGHVLVLAGGASPAALLAAIAPFRSRLLRQVVPVVVLSSSYPFGGSPAGQLCLPLCRRVLVLGGCSSALPTFVLRSHMVCQHSVPVLDGTHLAVLHAWPHPHHPTRHLVALTHCRLRALRLPGYAT